MQELRLEDCFGRKLVGFVSSDSDACGQAVLVFEGDVFAVLQIYRPWDPDARGLIKAEFGLDRDPCFDRGFGDQKLVEAGIISQELLDQEEQERLDKERAESEREDARREAEDRRDYERLKAKYEGKK